MPICSEAEQSLESNFLNPNPNFIFLQDCVKYEYK